MTDPTLEIPNRLKDPSLWHIVRNVPLFKPHTRGKYTVTEADLPTYVSNMNETEQRCGVPPRITVGHTKPDKPQHEQPKAIGYIVNRRVAPWGPGQVIGIVGDYYFEKDKAYLGKDLPFRSAEFYPQTKDITAVALLATDPELDLGIVLCDREYSPVPFALGRMPMSEEKTPDLGKMIAEGIAQYMKDQKPVTPPVENTLPETEVVRMAREETAIQLKRQQDVIARLEKDLETERYHRRTATAEQQIGQLENEGFVIKNRAKKVEKLAKLSETDAQDYLVEIRESYSRVPTDQPRIKTADSQEPVVTRELYDRAVSLATSKGVTFDAALSELRASK